MTGGLFDASESSPGDGDDAIADARRFGADEDTIAAIAAALTGRPGEGVWPENVAAVTAFLAAETQWRLVPLASGRLLATGLDYAGVKIALDAAGIAVTAELWAALQVMEREAVATMNAE